MQLGELREQKSSMWSRDKAPVVGLGDFIPQKLKLFAHLHIIFSIFCPMRDFFAGQMGEDDPMLNTLVSPRPILLLLSAPSFLSPQKVEGPGVLSLIHI